MTKTLTSNNAQVISINLGREDDSFYKCKHGYIFADINYNLYQCACRKNCEEIKTSCKNCKCFEEKGED